jgi:3-oxoacyl-[acyl-carrier-protein] synthase-3
MFKPRIAGTGEYLPGLPVTNMELEQCWGLPAEWTEHFVGTKTRHFCMDISTGKVIEDILSISIEAANSALVNAQMEPYGIEAIVLSTATPKYLMPTVATELADALGIVGIPILQVQSGCAGSIQALQIASDMLLAKRASSVLVVGADVCTKHYIHNRDFSSVSQSELVNYVLFGDGAGALVLTDDDAPGCRIPLLSHRFVGLGRPPGQLIDWFGLGDRLEDRVALKEDYKAIEKNVPILAKEALLYGLDCLSWDSQEISHIFPPQLSGLMTQRILTSFELGAAIDVSCVADTGNCGNALPFLQVHRALESMTDGSRGIGVAIESSKWIQAVFALEVD